MNRIRFMEIEKDADGGKDTVTMRIPFLNCTGEMMLLKQQVNCFFLFFNAMIYFVEYKISLKELSNLSKTHFLFPKLTLFFCD